MSRMWRITPPTDERHAIQAMGYRQVHRDLNRKRSTIWRTIWRELTKR